MSLGYTNKEAEEQDHCCRHESAEIIISQWINQKRDTEHADICDQSLRPYTDTDQLIWFGHVMRRDETTIHDKDSPIDLLVKGKRPRGRPRTSWLTYRPHSEGRLN